MPAPERLAEQFEVHRPHVRAVAYRMLASVSEAEDLFVLDGDSPSSPSTCS